MLLLLGSAEPDPRPEVGPTSGTNHDCNLKGHRGSAGQCTGTGRTRAQLTKVDQGTSMTMGIAVGAANSVELELTADD